MRYEIGQEIIAVAVVHTSKMTDIPDRSVPWLYDSIMHEDVVKLTVKEHVRVTELGFDSEACDRQPTMYDGFILSDNESRNWYNQYPHYHDDDHILFTNGSWKFIPSNGTLNHRYMDVLRMLTIYSDAISIVMNQKVNPLDLSETGMVDSVKKFCDLFSHFKKIAEEASGKKVVGDPEGERLKFKLV